MDVSSKPFEYTPFCARKRISGMYTKVVCRINDKDAAVKVQLVLEALLELLNYYKFSGGIGKAGWISNRGKGVKHVDITISDEGNIIIEFQDFSKR